MTHFHNTILIQLSFCESFTYMGPPSPSLGQGETRWRPFFNKSLALIEIFTSTFLLLANVSTRRQFDED
jgi:hypothetical protein